MTDIITTLTDNAPIIAIVITGLLGHLSGVKIQKWRNRFSLFVTLMDKLQKANADNAVTQETFTGLLESGIALIKS
jgi:hypothetical protein